MGTWFINGRCSIAMFEYRSSSLGCICASVSFVKAAKCFKGCFSVVSPSLLLVFSSTPSILWTDWTVTLWPYDADSRYRICHTSQTPLYHILSPDLMVVLACLKPTMTCMGVVGQYSVATNNPDELVDSMNVAILSQLSLSLPKLAQNFSTAISEKINWW